MQDKPIITRAKHTKGVTKVRVLITHPMIGYHNLDNSSDENSRPNFIQDITCSLNGDTIISVLCGSNVGKDPFLAFEFAGGNKGEIIEVAWVDNRGERDSTKVVIT